MGKFNRTTIEYAVISSRSNNSFILKMKTWVESGNSLSKRQKDVCAKIIAGEAAREELKAAKAIKEILR